MDTISHAAHGFILAAIISSVVGVPFTAAFAAGFMILGAMPDILGWLEKIAINDEGHSLNVYVDNTRWSWYNWAHDINNMWFAIIFPWGLHVCLDHYTHGEGKRWWVKEERRSWWYVNIVVTAILIGIILFTMVL